MKNWITQRKLLCAVAVLLLLAIYLRPLSLADRFPETEDLSIVWTDLNVLPPVEGETYSSLENEVTSYLLEAGTKERADFQDLLEGYSIHRTWRTPFSTDTLEGSNGAYLQLSWQEGDEVLYSVTGFDGPILVDGHIYSLGFLDPHRSLDMKERVSAFLGHCTPVSANES